MGYILLGPILLRSRPSGPPCTAYPVPVPCQNTLYCDIWIINKILSGKILK